MLDEIVEQLKIINDNKINKLAALNLLQAKLNHVFSFKNVKFLSINNTDKTCMAYYAFNFIASGGRKDKLIKDINKKLLPFFDKYLEDFNNGRRKDLESKYQNKKDSIANNTESKEKDLSLVKKEEFEALREFRKLEKVISNATMSSLYQSVEIIEQCGSGSLLFEESEFVNFYKDIIINKDKTKSDFFGTIFKFYDGDFTPTNTTSIQREQKTDIPLSCAFLSSPKMLISNDRLTNEFKDLLEQGIARRCFIYYKQNENFYLDDDIYYPTYEEIETATLKLGEYSIKLQHIFESINIGTVYKFSNIANNVVRKWKRNIDNRIKEFYRFSKNLSSESEILKLNLEHSTWKIIKLSILYHILSDCKNPEVQPESFEKACDFFEQSHKCLEDLLTTKVASDYENLYNYLVENRNKFISTMEIRNQKFVKTGEFSNWLKGAIPELENLCQHSKLKLVYTVTGVRNTGMSYALYDAEEYNYNIIKDLGNNNVIATLTDKSKSGLIELDTLDVE